ncbi:unnamed protein product [Effrenium voratum]|uniref:Uncharacterized protein n=1 Tax=Effrenium voratum TaxID=2562239 RepID=A0AA36MIY0_9DINO|nr:unnamed protein product [Effrenium voratum]
MPGHHHFFCAEWRRLRKVLPIEEELLYEFVVTARSWDNVPLDSGCDFVQANNLVGWMVEVEQDLFEHINDEFAEAVEGDGPKSARGRSTLSRERSMGRRSPRAASRCDRRSLSPARRSTPSRTATRSPTRSCTGLGSVQTSGGPSRPMLFKNPWHPLAKLSDSLGREEFVTELRKRLRAPRLFREAEDLPNAGGAGQGQGDPALTVEECEDLFEALMQLQKIAGASHLNPGVLAFGCNMDETVNTFYGILALRNAVERGAPSLNAFLAGLEAKDSKLVDPTLLRQFLTMVNYRLAGDTGIQDSIPVESIVKAHGEISMQEFRRRLSFAAPVGISLLEVQGHLEAKNGLGRSKLPGMIDFAQLAEHFCGEHLDISPLDLAHFVRLWGAHPGNLLSPQTMDEALERLPLEAYWGLEPFAVEHFFNILGMRCLQLERNKRKDACLPVEAVLEFARRDAPDLEKAEAAVPSDAALKERFEHLWGNCVGEGMLVAFPDGHSERVGSKEKAAHEHKAERRKEKERVGTARMKEACLARYLRSATEIMNQPVSRRQYESIFPNVSDILSVSNVNLRAGQVVVVRYRLAGACNFWHSKHRVLKDEREPLPWPVPGKVLGETPFVALVPRGLRWTNAGGGGFYLGSQSFNQVDPGLRADLPLDRDGKLQLYGTVEMVAPYLLRGSRRNASSATEELEFRLFSSRKNRIIGCVGEPLRVLVSHQALPPAVATLQVCCEGRTAKLRWAGYDFGEDASSEALVDALRLYVRTGSKESLLELETDGKQYELRDLAPDTDYEFHLRRESASSGGVEASCSCRTNARCSQPLNVLSAKASTTYVDLQWRAPEVVGNERTQDRWQLQCESIRRYEARLSVAEKLMDRRALARSRTSVQLREEVDTSCRQCSWEVGHFAAQEGLLTGRLGGLRPDTNYLLSGFCAVNSMGAGATAKELQFWTMPLNPVIESIRVRQGNVILTLLETGGEHVDEFEAVVRLEDGAERSFTLPKSALHGETPELSLEFQQMPESRSSDAVHCVKLRACNAGGWSTWSEELSTSAIARQQGADYAQNALEQAMEQRVPEKLARVLQDVRDIEFDDKSLVSEASDLLNILQTVQKEVEEAMAARDPDRLQNSLSDAHKVFLPGLEQAEGLLGTLQRVCQNLDTAKGIDALRASLREGHEARLPPTLLQRAVQRLGTREAAQQGLEMAMEAARVPVLRAALDTALDMHLPSEEAARRLLLAISGSERLLQAALESEEAQKDDGLPEKDLASACHILEELKEGELGRLERHLRQAAEAEDFRALQGLLHRARNAAALGVQVEQLDLENYRQLAHQQQEANIRKLQEDIHKQRIRNDWPAVYDKIEEGEEAEELEVEVVQLPAVVVSGEVQLDLYPRGIQKEFITLPREIVEAKIRIPLPDLSPDKEPVMEARQSLDALLESLRAMLAEEDELRRIGSMEIQDDGAYRDVTLPISLYLSARTSCQEVIEAFFRDPEDEPGRENSKGYRRSKSMSKRHAIKALWSCLSELGHSRSPELRSHCLHDVRGRVLRRITAELFWTQPASYRETMDATCVAMSADGLVEVVNARGVHGAYYGVDQGAFRVQSKGVDALFGAVSHLGTARAEAGSDLQSSLEGKMVCKQQMQVRLDLLPERVTDIFFLLAATNSRELGKFTHLGFRIADTDIGTTLAMQEDHRVQLTFEAVVIMCAIYKLGDGYWRIGSMNVSSSGSPRDLKAAIAKLEALGFPRKHETSSQENMVVDSVRRYLELPRSAVKAANVDIDSASTMTVQYAIEASDTAKGEQLEEKLKGNLHEAILDEFFKFTNEKVKPERLRVMPAAAKPLGHLHLEVRWEFGEVKRTDSKDHSYLDGALITFSGRCLQEIVDYRGPHGVRIVHNGVVDYDGMWIGPVGKSDAANRAIKHEGLVLDELPRTGKTSFEVRLDQLPPSTTDIYVVVSSPSGRELSKYSNIAVAAVDAWKSHQVCNCLLKSKPASQGVIFCRLSRSASGWKMGALRTPTSGGCHDFAPALECLRKIQGAGTSQAHQISIGDNGSRSERRLLPMKQLRSKGEKLQRQMSSGSISSLLTWSPARNPNSRRLGAAEMD